MLSEDSTNSDTNMGFPLAAGLRTSCILEERRPFQPKKLRPSTNSQSDFATGTADQPAVPICICFQALR
jgi:hypothetical protein